MNAGKRRGSREHKTTERLRITGAFQFIENKQFQEFCELYESKSHLRTTAEYAAQYAELVVGNYMLALLGAKRIQQLIDTCRDEIQKEEQTGKTVVDFYIGLSFGYLLQGNFAEAGKALMDGNKAKYQDIARTDAACMMYYEAVVTHNDTLKKESKKILRNRIRSKSPAPEFATAFFLLDKYDERSMLLLIDEITDPVLKCRASAKAFFYIAVKRLENGDMPGYLEALKQVCMLYDNSHAVTLEFEYYLAEYILQEERSNASSL